jgi:hypothetical protein
LFVTAPFLPKLPGVSAFVSTGAKWGAQL